MHRQQHRPALKDKLEAYQNQKENFFEWRCFHWGQNFFELPTEEQKAIINAKEWLYLKYEKEGKQSLQW